MERALKKFKNEKTDKSVTGIDINSIVSPLKDDLDKKTAVTVIRKFMQVMNLESLTNIELNIRHDDFSIIFHYGGKFGVNMMQICSVIAEFSDQTLNFSVYPEFDYKDDTYLGQCVEHTLVLGRNNYVITRTNCVTTWSTTVQRGSADIVNENQPFDIGQKKTLESTNVNQFYKRMDKRF